MDLNEKRLCNANPVETAEKLDGQDFWTKKACLTLSKNVKMKTKTVPTNPTCSDTRKVQQQNQGGSQKKNNPSRLHIAPATSVLFNQCLPEELQGKPNLWKIMVKLADDGKEPAAHALAFQLSNSKLFQSPNPHKQDSKVILQQMFISTYKVFHTGTISVPEEQCQEALQPKLLNKAW